LYSSSPENMEVFTNDVVLAIASFLPPIDLVHLGLTCKRFGGKLGATNDGAGVKRVKKRKKKKRKNVANVDEATLPLSLMNGLARGMVLKSEDEEWKQFLTKKHYESWIAVYKRLHQLRTSLVFCDFIGSGLRHVANDLSHAEAKSKLTRLVKRWPNATCATAKCQEVMRSGRHFANFTATWPGEDIKIGIMRPIRGWSQKRNAGLFDPSHYSPSFPDDEGGYIDFCEDQMVGYEGGHHSYFLSLATGQIGAFGPLGVNSIIEAWSTLEIMKEDKTVGLLLDLDKGELSVFIGKRPFGVKIRGIVGHFCWAAVIMANQSRDQALHETVWNETAVCIERAPVPEA